jgi:hypothetical protein
MPVSSEQKELGAAFSNVLRIAQLSASPPSAPANQNANADSRLCRMNSVGPWSHLFWHWSIG